MFELRQSCVLRQEMKLQSPYRSALYLYEGSKNILIDVGLETKKLHVPTALVRKDELEKILVDEKYAGTMGWMFFITKAVPKKYRHFAAFHGLAEYAAPRGFDVTGKAAHFQAIAVELGYAKTLLNSKDFDEYLRWRKNIERSDFFKLETNGLIDRVAGKIPEIFTSIPQYLTYRRKQLVELVEDFQ